MTDRVYCVQCGGELDPDTRVCAACGAEQPVVGAAREEGGTTDREAQPTRTAGEQIERISPGASEFAQQLAAEVRTPGVVRAGLSALIGLGAMIVVGILVSALFPDKSAISFGDMGLFNETLNQACAFTLASFTAFGGELTLRFTPALFALVPLLGTGIPAYLLARRAREKPAPHSQVAWGLATGIPFALLMLLPALAAGESSVEGLDEIRPSVGGVFVLSAVWGALGGGVGALFALARPQRSKLAPERVRPVLQLAWPGMKALLLALAATTAIGATAVVVQTVRDVGDIRGNDGKSILLGSIDSALYAVEHGTHFHQLGAGVAFKRPSVDAVAGLPFPVVDYEELTAAGGEDPPSDLDEFDDLDFDLGAPEFGTFRIFDYRDAMPAWAFIPFLGLIVIPALFAVYGGFSIARGAAIRTPRLGAAWGALVGPLWALAMVVLNAAINKEVFGTGVFGSADGDSVFVMYLLGGAVLGALGGALATQGSPTGTGPSPNPPREGP